MSRIGKQIIVIPAGVEVIFKEPTVTVKGPKGTLTRDILDNVEIRIEGREVTVQPRRNDIKTRALWGTYASHIKNMIHGVVTPFEKKLLIEGGAKIQQQILDSNLADEIRISQSNLILNDPLAPRFPEANKYLEHYQVLAHYQLKSNSITKLKKSS